MAVIKQAAYIVDADGLSVNSDNNLLSLSRSFDPIVALSETVDWTRNNAAAGVVERLRQSRQHVGRVNSGC